MYVYLHGIVIGIIRGFNIYPFKDHISILTYIYLLLFTSIIVYVLSTRFISKWTNPIINLQSLRILKIKIISNRFVVGSNML